MPPPRPAPCSQEDPWFSPPLREEQTVSGNPTWSGCVRASAGFLLRGELLAGVFVFPLRQGRLLLPMSLGLLGDGTGWDHRVLVEMYCRLIYGAGTPDLLLLGADDDRVNAVLSHTQRLLVRPRLLPYLDSAQAHYQIWAGSSVLWPYRSESGAAACPECACYVLPSRLGDDDWPGKETCGRARPVWWRRMRARLQQGQSQDYSYASRPAGLRHPNSRLVHWWLCYSYSLLRKLECSYI